MLFGVLEDTVGKDIVKCYEVTISTDELDTGYAKESNLLLHFHIEAFYVSLSKLILHCWYTRIIRTFLFKKGKIRLVLFYILL